MKVKVYQIDSESDINGVKFMNYEFTQKHGGIDPQAYRRVFSGDIDATNPEQVYELLNRFERPARLFGHSLSISDLIEITEDTPNWKGFSHTKDGNVYFFARMAVTSAFLQTLRYDMDYMTSLMIDPLTEVAHSEINRLSDFLSGRTLASPEEMRPYLAPLIGQFAEKTDDEDLRHYGWTKQNVMNAIAQHLYPEELKDIALHDLQNDIQSPDDKARDICAEVTDVACGNKLGYIPETTYVPVTRKGIFFCDSIGFEKVDVDTSGIQPADGVRCLMLLPGKAPEEIRIPDRLEIWQNAVSDHGEPSLIEVTYPFDDNAVLVGNEESKLISMQGNRHIGGQVYAGPLYIVGDTNEGEFCSLTDKQIKEYKELFANPEDISPEEVEANTGFTIFGM